MKRTKSLATAVLLVTAGAVSAIEEPRYDVLERHGAVEIRRYDAFFVAGVRVEAEMERAGNAAFRSLFRYISGNYAANQKIAMTAPVTLAGDADNWTVTFAMPADFGADSLPSPTDPSIEIVEMPAETIAAVRYSGGWKEARDRDHEAELRAQLATLGLTACGGARFARYNSPFSLPMMRRNEVLIPITNGACPTGG